MGTQKDLYPSQALPSLLLVLRGCGALPATVSSGDTHRAALSRDKSPAEPSLGLMTSVSSTKPDVPTALEG